MAFSGIISDSSLVLTAWHSGYCHNKTVTSQHGVRGRHLLAQTGCHSMDGDGGGEREGWGGGGGGVWEGGLLGCTLFNR